MYSRVDVQLSLWRKTTGLKQEDAAALLGLSPSTYQNYERGTRRPDTDGWEKFARAGINTNWLLTGEGPMLLSNPLPKAANPEDQGKRFPGNAAQMAQPTYLDSSGVSPRNGRLEQPHGVYAVAHQSGIDQRSARLAADVDARLLRLCRDACLAVHGLDFSTDDVGSQIDYAAGLYNLLLRLSAAKRPDGKSGPTDFSALSADDMSTQLRLFLQLGWLPPYPRPSR